jgi:hypothetical protein
MIAKLGPAIYLARDGSTLLACIITLVERDGSCCITVFPPGKLPEFYNRIKHADRPDSIVPGTVWREPQ